MTNINNEAQCSKTKADDWSAEIRLKLRRKSLDIARLVPYYLGSLSLLKRFLEYRIFYSRFDQLKEQVLVYDYTCSLSDLFMIESLTA